MTMTIVSVVFVPEGIAMAADSRLTGTRKRQDGFIDRFVVTDNAQKLVLLRKATIGVSFYGDAIIEGKTVADFLRNFDINLVKVHDTVAEIANNLKEFLEQGFDQYDLSFLLAGYDSDEPYIYNVNKHGVTLINYNEVEEISYGCSWRGEVATIQKLLCGSNLEPNLMPLKDAVDLAEFIVDTTVKYSRFKDSLSTCGGPTDILVITKDYTKFLKHKILQP
jgi:hypothetical protein